MPTAIDLPEHIANHHISECVYVDISCGYEKWKTSLSKSARQNQRTAYNRLKTDNKEIEIKHMVGCLPFKELYKQLFLHRYRNIERRNNIVAFWYYPLIAIAALFDLDDPWSRMLMHNENCYSASCMIDGKMAAYVSGIIYDRRFIIPYLSYNSSFRRYDPGRIVINESIKYLCERDLADIFDLYKGSEQYKFDNGGKMYRVYQIYIKHEH